MSFCHKIRRSISQALSCRLGWGHAVWDTVRLTLFDQSYVVSAGAMADTFLLRVESSWSKIPKFRLGGKWKTFFGSPDLKIPGKNETAQKVVPFSRLERPNWFLALQLQHPGNLNQIITAISFRQELIWCTSVSVACSQLPPWSTYCATPDCSSAYENGKSFDLNLEGVRFLNGVYLNSSIEYVGSITDFENHVYVLFKYGSCSLTQISSSLLSINVSSLSATKGASRVGIEQLNNAGEICDKMEQLSPIDKFSEIWLTKVSEFLFYIKWLSFALIMVIKRISSF